VLLQDVQLQGENARAEGFVHIKALEYAVCITGCTQVSQSSRPLSRVTKILRWIRTETADNILGLLPETSLANPIGGRNQPTETVGRVLGVPMAAMADRFPHHIKMADVALCDIAGGVYLPAKSVSKSNQG
jgi:hypothetical protein